ncbi:GntR family transcriptional regulator [Nakamurella sp. YIM 132087]|uniref:GntR family transcriptional regulator n=1 Tax=Nakamurella alba TaxID=2665158 RepID=A0A7K1FE92_9ACTN|nr:GntR family transcriptional regulator [Nakamurella alba]MTD12390.1 GntR family transcriptional regulator [Nakamurella alba]
MTPAEPSYRSLANDLRARIARQDFGQEGRLPTESALSEQYGLSRQTVRRAYQELAAEGLVRRYRRWGTFASPPGQYIRTFGALDDVIAMSPDAEVRVIRALGPQDQPDSDAVLALDTTEICEIQVLRLNNDVAFGVARIYLPAELGERLAESGAVPGSGEPVGGMIISRVEQVWPRPVALVRQELTVAPVGDELAPLIGCSPGQSVLRINRVFLDNEDVPVQYTVNYFNSDRYRYRVELHRNHRSEDGGVFRNGR